MNIQHVLLGIVAAILLVASSYGAPVNENETNVTTDSNFTNPITTLITTITTPNVTITTALVTTANATSDPTMTTAALTTAANATNPTSSITSVTTATSSTSTKTMSPITKAPRRKFDGLSFIGGMILAGGLGGIIFLIVSYLRRSNRLPYSNLQ